MIPAADAGLRTVVVGTSGAGKTTLARRLALARGMPHVELDALHWEPDWVEAPDAVMRERVTTAIAGDRWVVDGNYLQLADLVWARATRIVWLDLPFPVVLTRVVLRTLRRGWRGEVLWSGNRESLWKNLTSRESVIWWAVRTFAGRRRTYGRRMTDPAAPPFVRLRSRRDVTAFLAAEGA